MEWESERGVVSDRRQADSICFYSLRVHVLLGWAISTGADRSDIQSVDDLKGKKIGISRLGRSVLPHSSVFNNLSAFLEFLDCQIPCQMYTYMRAGLLVGKQKKFGPKEEDMTDRHTTSMGWIPVWYSGSYIMSFVLAQQKGWLEAGKEPFEFVVLDNFKNLRDAVNSMSTPFHIP